MLEGIAEEEDRGGMIERFMVLDIFVVCLPSSLSGEVCFSWMAKREVGANLIATG